MQKGNMQSPSMNQMPGMAPGKIMYLDKIIIFLHQNSCYILFGMKFAQSKTQFWHTVTRIPRLFLQSGFVIIIRGFVIFSVNFNSIFGIDHSFHILRICYHCEPKNLKFLTIFFGLLDIFLL